MKKRSLPFGKYCRRTIYSRERFRGGGGGGVEKRVIKIGRALGGNICCGFYSPIEVVWKFETASLAASVRKLFTVLKRLKPASTEDGYKPFCSVDRP